MISVRSTGDIPLSKIEIVLEESPISEITEIDESQYFFRSTQAPSWVHFVANADTWLALAAAGVSVYASGFLSEAGKDGWKNRKAAPRAIRRGSQMLLQLAVRIVTLQNLVGTGTRIEVGIPTREEHFPALLPITVTSPEDIELQLTRFSAHSAGLAELLNRDDVRPISGVILALLENGGLSVEWVDSDSLQKHREILSG